MHSSFKKRTRKRIAALIGACAFGLIAAGCKNHNLYSDYAVVWTTLTSEPGPFTSYIVNVDSVVLTGKSSGPISAIAVPETVDLTKLNHLSELWASATIPVDTYTAAAITLDYSAANVSVMVNGAPVQATVIDPATGVAATTIAVTVTIDPNDQLTLLNTFATTNAQRLIFDVDLAASNTVNLTTSPPTVTIKPFFTMSTSAPDSKLIRVRGPLINSSVDIGTYSVVIRPFFDEVNDLGTLSIFNSASTIYTINGSTYVGTPGIRALSQTSADSTITAAFCTFTPTATLTPGVTAGIFNSDYVVAGGTLEDFYTYGLEGDVIARSGNTLTLRGSTLFLNAAELVQYEDTDSLVILGPGTTVTADGIATLGPLNYNSISVGQHITVRGIYSLSATNVVTLDATGTSATDTGSVRIQSTQIYGSLISSASGSLLLNLQNINEWPASIFNFAGNGTSSAQDPTPAAYVVGTGTLGLPNGPDGTPVAAGDPLWIDGFSSPFGTAPPDFNAQDINAEPTVPATLVVTWNTTGTTAPFATLTDSGLTMDLTNAAFVSGQLHIGAESIDITTLGASPQIVPQTPSAVVVAGAAPLFQPLFGVGNAVSGISSFNGYAAFVTQLNTTFATTPAMKFTANGVYNRATNLFSASKINVVL